MMEISVITTEENNADPLGSTETETKPKRCQKCYNLLPSKTKIILTITQLLILIFFAGALYGILEKDVLPGSEIFALLLLALSANIGGKIISFIGMPPLLGMLITGFIFRNVPFIPYHTDISILWSAALKDIALVIILLKAGLGLDSDKLRKFKMVVFRLSFIPCLVETAATGSFSHLLLGLPWTWALMLGFIVSAVSPAVIVPSMLSLQERCMGVAKGIPTLVMAAASIDDVIAITGFTVMFSIAFSTGNLTWIIIKGPLEPLVGFVLGAVFGVLFWYLPSNKSLRPTLIYYRSLMLCFGGLALMFVSKQVGMAGSGPLGCISIAFIAALRWRKDPEQFSSITCVTGIMWKLVQPFLFGLIGAEVTIKSLQTNLGFGALTLVLGIIVRMIGTVFVTFGTKLNIKEKIFVSCAWLAKATVQAAVGSQALDYARFHNKGDEYINYGNQVLTMSVLSIIMTAPIGAGLIAILSPFLLTKDEKPIDSTEINANEEMDRIEKANKSQPDYGSCDPIHPTDILRQKNDV